MKKRLLLTFMLFFIFKNIIAQEVRTVSISGKVLDATSKEALEYATIILKESNSDNVLGIITDTNGFFKISVPKGKYDVSIEFLSYQTKTFTDFEIKENIDFGTIHLSPEIESLNAIEIEGNAKLVNISLSKNTYNVEKDISAQGKTALDILENAPSVSVENGVPKIRGAIATVLINGRISALSKTDALQSMQASTIKKIEVITAPSARFSANKSGGIINIILKKGLDNGLNGSITTTVGIKDVYGASTSINYRKNKVNFYTNTSYFHRKPISKSSFDNEYFENGITSGYLKEDRMNTRKNIVFNTTMGIDYYINDYVSLNVQGSYAKYNGKFNSTNISNYFDASHTNVSIKEQLNYTDHNDDIYDFSLTYDQYFEKEGEELFISLSHSNDKEINNSLLFYNDLFPTSMALPNEDERIFDDLDLTNTNWLIYYVFPTSEFSTFEIGSDGELGKININYTNEIIDNNEFVINPNTSNILNYTENWFGIYAQFIRNSDKFSYLLALRTEITDLNIDLRSTNEQSSQNYTDIFPTVQLEYSFKDDKTLALSYMRGIQRATYFYFNPFEQRISETTSYKGNINLLPFYANTFELRILNKSESKFTVNPAIYFRNYDNIWQEITVETGEIVNGVPKLLTSPVNLGYLNFTGIELLTTYKPNDKLEFNSTIDFNYQKQDGVYKYTNTNNELVTLDYSSTGFSGSVDLNTTIKLPFNINFQSLIKYNLASEGSYSKRYAYAYMNASLNKELFNKKATITLSASDIFDSNKTKRLRWTNDVNSLSKSQWREPSILLSFTYRFNQSKKDRSIDIHKKDIEIKY